MVDKMLNIHFVFCFNVLSTQFTITNIVNNRRKSKLKILTNIYLTPKYFLIKN